MSIPWTERPIGKNVQSAAFICAYLHLGKAIADGHNGIGNLRLYIIGEGWHTVETSLMPIVTVRRDA